MYEWINMHKHICAHTFECLPVVCIYVCVCVCVCAYICVPGLLCHAFADFTDLLHVLCQKWWINLKMSNRYWFVMKLVVSGISYQDIIGISRFKTDIKVCDTLSRCLGSMKVTIIGIRACHPVGHWWDKCPCVISLEQVTAIHSKMGNPQISPTGARSSNEFQILALFEVIRGPSH